jgi:LAS superfamily LD-carboxypeptidase LdcB
MKAISKDDLLGKFVANDHSDFVQVKSGNENDADHFLRKDAAMAWELMRLSALPDNIHLKLVSSTRNFERQKQIWENKWSGKTPVNGVNFSETEPDNITKAKEILKFSAMPGTSRHHWGTDIDINSVEEEYFQSAQGKDVYRWLKVNAPKFGFDQPYTAKSDSRPLGYEEEKWHWSFLPLSKVFLRNFMSQIDYSDIAGFEGAELAQQLKVIPIYVFGINSVCR